MEIWPGISPLEIRDKWTEEFLFMMVDGHGRRMERMKEMNDAEMSPPPEGPPVKKGDQLVPPELMFRNLGINPNKMRRKR